MDRVAPVAHNRLGNGVKSPIVEIGSVSSQNYKEAPCGLLTASSLQTCTNSVIAAKSWKPPALRTSVLIFTVLTCWALIALLQIYLTKSQRDGGVLFAAKIEDLPFHQQFLYMYFPTVIAVLFSIYWAWIDLETKRMEPYYQLSKPDGALGRDSLLLHYPFDFIPLVPIKAAKDR
jgi:hypothetical protein